MSYEVEVQPNGKPITGASLEMQFGQITGTGRATVLADMCPEDGSAASCGTQKVELKVVLSADGSKKPLDNAQFKEPLKAIRVITPVYVAPGSGGVRPWTASWRYFVRQAGVLRRRSTG